MHYAVHRRSPQRVVSVWNEVVTTRTSSGDSIDLDLTAGSSTFEEMDTNIQLGTQPYLFEPEADIDE